MAFISWFAVVFRGEEPRGLWDFITYYMRWWVRVAAYAALLRDDYPPFGDEPYPTTYEVTYPAGGRHRLSVGLRLIYVIPHIVVLIFVNIAWTVTTIIAWFAILFTRAYPAGLYRFAVGAMRWNVRVPVLPAPAARRVPALQPGGVTARRTSVHPSPTRPAEPSAAHEPSIRHGRPLELFVPSGRQMGHYVRGGAE